ncbi:MAG: DUF1631 family protein [Burkholderiales bacterium]
MPQTTQFDSILAQCRDLFTERLVAAVSAMLDKADEALSEFMQETRDQHAQEVYRETRDKALAQRETIETQFRVRYLREFQQRSNHAKKIGGALDDIDLDSIELALVGEDDLNETLKYNALAARLRKYCEEELVALDQRIGVLFGDAALNPDDNPFNPQAVCDAYKMTCSQIDSNVEVRMALLKLFDDLVLDDIRGIYRAVNALLVQNAILPKIRGVGGVRREPDEAEAKPEEATPEQDFFALLQKLVARKPGEAAQTGIGARPGVSGASGPTPFHMPGQTSAQDMSAGANAGSDGTAGGGGGGAPQILQGPELMRSLTRVQLGDVSDMGGNTVQLAVIINEPGTHNVLRELKGTSLGGGMSEMDAMTLDIVALLFDELFDDPGIPIGVKGLIGRLQIPILKVAIADKAFFATKHHPARLMLDTLGEIAARMLNDIDASNPAFVRLDKLLQALLEGFEDDIGIFEATREQLKTLLDEEEQRVEQETQSAGEQIERDEKLALAKTVAQTEIKMRLRGSKLPRPILEFLSRQWIKVLILYQVKHGEESDDWKNALKTMDLLVWSVEPKSTLEERRELVGKVPQLLKGLNEGLHFAGIEDAVRTQFVADLRKLHSLILTTAAKVKPAEPASQPAEAAPQAEAPAAAPGPVDAGVPGEPAPREEPATAAGPEAPTPGPVPQFELPEVKPAPQAPIEDAPKLEPMEEKTPVQPSAPIEPEQKVESPSAPKPPIPPAPAAPQEPTAPAATRSEESAPPDFTAPVKVNNPFGEGEVEVDDLDFTVALRGPSGAKPPPALPPELVVGSWVRILLRGEEEKQRFAKLNYISPLKTRFLFVDRLGKTALDCTQAELVKFLEIGEVTIATEPPAEQPLFDRIAEGAIGKLGGKK